MNTLRRPGRGDMQAESRTNMEAQSGPQRFAALFIDYENVYYHLKAAYADIPELNDAVIELLMSLQKRLEETFRVRSIISKAYADFERLRSTPQGSLYLMGVETFNVLGTDHKNAADMKLCIDAMEVLYTRPEIQHFVIFAGDRDYIPLIQHLKKQAKTVIAVGFEANFSGDLLLNVGRPNFIDANGLFSPERLLKLEEMAKRYNDYLQAENERKEQREREEREREERAREEREQSRKQTDEAAMHAESAVVSTGGEGLSQPASNAGAASGPVVIPSDSQPASLASRDRDANDALFNKAITDLDENERACLEVLLRNFGKYHDIFLTPFLRTLSDALPHIADWQRKALLGNLEFKGVLNLEKRTGIPYDFTVIVLNYNHPVVREMY